MPGSSLLGSSSASDLTERRWEDLARGGGGRRTLARPSLAIGTRIGIRVGIGAGVGGCSRVDPLMIRATSKSSCTPSCCTTSSYTRSSTTPSSISRSHLLTLERHTE